MRLSLLVLLLLPLNAKAGPGSADDAYLGARKAYHALKADPARRKLRHNWLNVVKKFEAVASHHPKSPRAPDALFTSAELLQELSRISMLDEDRQAAVVDYQKLCDGYPRHRLADDAALALARVYAERLNQPELARKVIARALEHSPKGDQAGALKALAASLPKVSKKPSPKRVVAPSSGRTGALSEALARVSRADVAVKAKALPSAESAAESAGDDPADSDDAPEEEGAPSPAPAEAAGNAVAQEKAQAPAEAAGKAEAREKRPAGVEPSGKADAREARPALVEAPVSPAMARERLKTARPRSGEITLAEQLGLKFRRVVIDAGHGGRDSGAVGPHGTQEKDVALAIALRLSEILAAAGLDVLLTRDDDSFVRLEDRAKIANEAKGDLFISVHCNSAASAKLRGIETYTLNTSSDRYSIRLAARENSSSERRISDLQFILADLATKANTDESARLSARVQKSLTGQLGAKYKGVRDLGTKEALFYVLLGAKMPAILVETSFLSNPEDEQRLSSKTYQEDVAQAIAAGVQDFLGNRQRLAKVD